MTWRALEADTATLTDRYGSHYAMTPFGSASRALEAVREFT